MSKNKMAGDWYHSWLLVPIFLLMLPGLILTQPLNFEEFTLANGLKVYYQQDPQIKFTTVVFHFTGGQSLEKENQAGLSYLTIRLMAEVADEDKLAELLSSGINLNAGSGANFSYLQFDCCSQYLEKTLAIVASGLKKPTFSGLRIDNVKKTLRLESGKEACRLIDSALICLKQQLFPRAPYRHSLFGTEASLKSLTRKEVSQFYDSLVNSANLSLIVISDLESQVILNFFSKHLAWIKKSGILKAEPAYSISEKGQAGESSSHCDYYRGPAGAAALLGYPLPGEISQIYPAAYVLEKMIGEGPASLIWSLRQETGLAYNVNSRLEIIERRPIFICYLETDSEEARQAQNSLEDFFARLSQEGWPEKEIAAGRVLARNTYLRESAGREARLSFLSILLANNLAVSFYNKFLNYIDSVTADDLNRLLESAFKPEQAYEIFLVKD